MENCIFCNIEPKFYVEENKLAYAILDLHPATPGHTLFIPKRHSANFFEMPAEDLAAIKELIGIRQTKIKKEDPSVEGFNIQVNIGEISGQTIMHTHIHLIPRRKGDGFNCLV